MIADGPYDRRIPFRLSGDMGQVVNSINRLKALIVNGTAPTPTMSVDVEPKPVVAKEKGGEENG